MRIDKPKKIKKPSRKSLIVKLDKLTSERVRSKGYCEKCHSEKNLQCAHIYSRNYKHLRWEPENLLCLCAGCHFWWHQNPTEAVLWAQKKRDFKYLAEIRQINAPMKDWELSELLEYMTHDFEQHDLSVANERA